MNMNFVEAIDTRWGSSALNFAAKLGKCFLETPSALLLQLCHEIHTESCLQLWALERLFGESREVG